MPVPNHPNSLHHQRDLIHAPQRVAGIPSSLHQQSFEDQLPLNAQYSGTPFIPLDTNVVEVAVALETGVPRLITTATSSPPLPGAANLPSLPAEVGSFSLGLKPL